MKAISMFSSAGIGELYLKDVGIDVVLANELLPKRAKFYSQVHNSKVIVGDITDCDIFNEYVNNIPNDVKMLIATPPCQGVSLLGKNKSLNNILNDERNYLFLYVEKVAKLHNFDYILIENVPNFFNMHYYIENKLYNIKDYINIKFGDKYDIKFNIFNAKDYGVPQNRKRAIIRMFKKGLTWDDPVIENEITVRDAISHLPTLEAGEKSIIGNHYAKKHAENQVLAMKYTPSGKSAHDNEFYYPKKPNGDKIKGFHNTYKRMSWDKPAPIRAMSNGSISSHDNVHPGRKLEDGTYSDARVLTLHELFIVHSIDGYWDYPKDKDFSDTFMRHIIGESVPPRLMSNIVKGIKL